MFSRKRLDANHGTIKRAFEALGAGVHDASRAGDGLTDLIVFWRGTVLLVEVKDGSKPPSARELTDAQQRFRALAAAHGVKVLQVKCEQQVYELLGGRVSA